MQILCISLWESSSKNHTNNAIVFLHTYFSNGMKWNIHIERKVFKVLKCMVWKRVCWVENFKKIDKRTPTFIR